MRAVTASPRSALRFLWLLLPVLAVGELAAHYAIVAKVPKESDWRAAAGFVAKDLQRRDLVTSAPAWTDPLLREAMGKRMTAAMAARSDTAPFERLWVLSIRGANAPEAPSSAPAVDKSFGKVRVRRWDLPPSSVVYDFLDHWDRASVTLTKDGEDRACPRVHTGYEGGGLGRGPELGPDRFQCPGRRGPQVTLTTIEDLDYAPRRCIEQPPAGKGTVGAHFGDVPLGKTLTLYGGLYNRDERNLEGAPITATVLINGKAVGSMVRRDGDGWKRADFPTPGGRGEVTIQVTAPSTKKRGFCWAATTRTK